MITELLGLTNLPLERLTAGNTRRRIRLGNTTESLKRGNTTRQQVGLPRKVPTGKILPARPGNINLPLVRPTPGQRPITAQIIGRVKPQPMQLGRLPTTAIHGSTKALKPQPTAGRLLTAARPGNINLPPAQPRLGQQPTAAQRGLQPTTTVGLTAAQPGLTNLPTLQPTVGRLLTMAQLGLTQSSLPFPVQAGNGQPTQAKKFGASRRLLQEMQHGNTMQQIRQLRSGNIPIPLTI